MAQYSVGQIVFASLIRLHPLKPYLMRHFPSSGFNQFNPLLAPFLTYLICSKNNQILSDMKGLNLVFRLLVTAFVVGQAPLQLAAQCQSGNCQNGTGVYRYSSISTYSGQFLNGLRHGKGKMIMQNGNVYEGQFVKSNLQGQGSMTYTNGDRYVGLWANDQPNGQGKYFFKSRERYEGRMANGEFEGQGTMYYNDGAYYVGGWKANRKHGVGKLVAPNGKTTSGSWSMGKAVNITSTATASVPTPSRPVPTTTKPNTTKPSTTKPDVANLRNCGTIYCRNGQGFYDYPDGSRWIGEFKDGYPNGRGICHYANGDRYDGEWANNAPYGEGVMYFASGRVYGAVWMNGAPIKELDSPEAVPSDPVRVDPSKTVKIWAVIVGVGRYTAMPSLKFTDDDAYRFYSFLKSPEGGALPDNQIAVLVDEEATRANILRTMRQNFLKADANDVVLFYYSGHGIEGSFLPVDYDGFNNKLRHEEIKQVFKESKAKHKLCIADACHSGTLSYNSNFAAKGPAPVSTQRYYQAFEEADGGIALLMSSKAEELSLEDQGLRQGVFTYYVLQGLKGKADANSDYLVTIKELYNFVYTKVRDYTANVQTPILTGDYDDNMPVALRRN